MKHDDVPRSGQPQARRRRLQTALPFIGPWFVGFVLFTLIPFGCSLYWSFCRFDLLTSAEFVGLENYRRLASELSSNQGFGLAIWNTAYYAAIHVPLSIALGIGLAVMLSWNVRGQGIYRTICFLPSMVPVVASSILWIWMLDPTDGIVNHCLSWIGLPEPLWLNEPAEALSPWRWANGTASVGAKDALILMSLWSVGNFMLIYLAALSDVPPEVHEAAAMDGAGRWKRFWHVSLPHLTPVILFNLVMGLIQSVQAFTQMYIVSEGTGAPERSTLVLSMHLFLSAFQDLDMGYASAISWIVFLALVVATLLLFRSVRHWVHYASATS